MFGKLADDITVHDDTTGVQYKQVAEKIPDSEAVLHMVLESVDEGIVVTDLAGDIRYLNSTAIQLHSHNSKRGFVGRSVFELITEKQHSRVRKNLERVLEGGRVKKAVCILSTINGREFPGELKVSVLKDSYGTPEGFLVFIKDITKQKLAKTQLASYRRKLRSLTSRLSFSEEYERQRIAAQVHDRVSQALALCRIKLGGLINSAPSPHFTEQLDEINQYIRQLIEEIRSLTFELGSPVLYQLGLEKAVEHLTKDLQKDHGILASFEDDGESKPLDDDIRIFLFQVVRELLSNVVKHAQAHGVHVCIKRQGGDILITVEDDGVGFDTRRIAAGNGEQNMGFGLFSIRERLGYLDRQLKVESEPGYGTRVTVAAPLRSGRTKKRA
ncbi:MAG: PAS domain S-box protein [Dehalococcoidales bacterium]|nr:MAG: PAS domain S-box protein [Dehalococcoidales bacterium]